MMRTEDVSSAGAPPGDDPRASEGRDAALVRLTAIVLRLGTALSLLLIAAGGALATARHPGSLASAQEYLRLTRPSAAGPHAAAEILRGALRLEGKALIMLGVLTLLATPIARVAVSVALFARRGERAFAIMALAALAIVGLSVIAGRAV